MLKNYLSDALKSNVMVVDSVSYYTFSGVSYLYASTWLSFKFEYPLGTIKIFNINFCFTRCNGFNMRELDY